MHFSLVYVQTSYKWCVRLCNLLNSHTPLFIANKVNLLWQSKNMLLSFTYHGCRVKGSCKISTDLFQQQRKEPHVHNSVRHFHWTIYRLHRCHYSQSTAIAIISFSKYHADSLPLYNALFPICLCCLHKQMPIRGL